MVMRRATRAEEDKTTEGKGYSITSPVHDGMTKIAYAVCAHWALDVASLAGRSRIRSAYAAENIAAMGKIANNALK
ncbi:MAG: hypothetical protein R6V12_07940 [Candidatus Hydrogenedentota bacterium]